MHKPGVALGVALGIACFPSLTRGSPDILPLRSVRLYEIGVGYFERSGALSPRSTVLPVPAGQLDDALKTMVVFGKGGPAQVGGIEFASSISRDMGRALAGLPQPDDGALSYRDLLVSMKGADLAVRTAQGSTSGRLVEVIEAVEEAPKTRTQRPRDEDQHESDDEKQKKTYPELTIFILTGKGELRRFRTSQIVSLRPTDPAFATRLASALDATSTHGAQTRRMLRLLARSSAQVTIGYVAEAPVWRTSYRLVLAPDGETGVLQGWALIHNDADEDWRGVRVSLVNGQPDSFLYPLAAPRYGKREMIHLDTELATVPQLLDTTVDALSDGHEESVSYGSGGGAGFGRSVGRVAGGVVGGVVGGATVPSVSASSLVSVGDLASINQAEGVESGALFHYTLAVPLELRAHGSALVPFTHQPIDAEAITWFGAVDQPARAAVRLVNTTSQTLPAGPIAFFLPTGFAGESVLDRLKPGEERFLQFGVELDVKLEPGGSQQREETRRLVTAAGRLAEHFVRHSNLTYAIENRSASARRVHLALQIAKNAKVTGADRVAYDATTSHPVVEFRVPAKQRVIRTVSIDEGLSRQSILASLTAARLAELAAEPSLPARERDLAAKAAAEQREVESARGRSEALRSAAAKTDQDLARWRENLKAIGGPAARHPFIERVLRLEDQRNDLQSKIELLEQEISSRSTAVRKLLERLTG